MSHNISKRLFSTENTKAIKAGEYGQINAIHYIAPSDFSGVRNVCPNASAGCINLCLGWFSGQSAMVANAENRETLNNVRLSRINKARAFFDDRDAYLRELLKQAQAIEAKAWRDGLQATFRFDGSSDLGLAFMPFNAPDIGRTTLAEALPQSTVAEYTKALPRMLKYLAGHFPGNAWLTFSRSETNEAQCRQVLQAGGNVAVVFRKALPAEYLGRPVIDGDQHDLRQLDPRGVVVGLKAKGSIAKRDRSGFIVDCEASDA